MQKSFFYVSSFTVVTSLHNIASASNNNVWGETVNSHRRHAKTRSAQSVRRIIEVSDALTAVGEDTG